MVVGAEGCPHKDMGWGMVGRHKEHTAQGQALSVGGTERALAHSTGMGTAGAQPGQEDTGRTAGMGGFWLPVGQVGPGAPRAAALHHAKHPASPLLPAAPHGRALPIPPCPMGGTSAGHGLSQRASSTPHQPHRRCLWRHSRVLGKARPCPQAQDEGWSVGSRAGSAGGPAEPSCRDVAGMCVGGSRGGGEGGRGSSRSSSSFDKQLPEHFQTVVSDRHARCLRACAGTHQPTPRASR